MISDFYHCTILDIIGEDRYNWSRVDRIVVSYRAGDTGCTVAVHDQDINKTQPFQKLGVAKSTNEVAVLCEFILISVTNSNSAQEICFGSEGITSVNSGYLVQAGSSTVCCIIKV
jgi:3-hydroxyisobutyrate dehydrogenase-like beta-hydroxyacid dehydrogenase